jgi:hypothetical protein
MEKGGQTWRIGVFPESRYDVKALVGAGTANLYPPET